MDKITYNGSQKQIERFILAVYTFYSITLLLISIKQQWGRVNDLIWGICLMSAWTLYLGRYKTYQFRMKFTAVLVQISVILYAMHGQNYQATLPTFMVFVVVLSLPGIAQIIYMTVFSSVLIFCYHAFWAQTIVDMSISLSQLMNVFLLEFLVLYVVGGEVAM